MPKISVVMPAYNAEKYIKEAIDSVLNQTFCDFELIIINDCSRDATEELILSYHDPRIVYLKNECNLGVAATLNRGLSVARGNYVARMDSDDIAMPERFEKQVHHLENNPNIVVCGSNVVVFSDAGTEKLCCYPEKDSQIKAALLFACSFAHPSVMIRRNVLITNGLEYEEAFEKVEDYRLWSRLASFGDFANLPEPLLRYRTHSGQVCATSSQAQYEGKVRLAATLLDRIGICEESEQRVIVDAFDGRIISKDAFDKFESLAMRIISNTPEDLDMLHIRTMLKSKIIEIALTKHFAIKVRCIRIVGIKGWLYVYWQRMGGGKA